MRVSSKASTGQVLAIALAIIFWGFAVPVSQAKSPHPQGCQQEAHSQGCPHEVVVVQTCCAVDSHAQHEAEEAMQKAAAKAQKEAEHAQHEAEEAQARQLKEAEHAQHEAAEACARNQKAYLRALHEAEEAQERANAKMARVNDYGGAMCKVSEQCH